MKELIYIGEQIIQQRFKIVQQIFNYSDEEYLAKVQVELGSADALMKWRAEVIRFIGEGIVTEDMDMVKADIKEWAKESSRKVINQGIYLDKPLELLSVYRSALWELIGQVVEEKGVSAKVVLEVQRIVDMLLDYAVHVFSTSFIDDYKQSMALAQQAIQDMSVPVISLTEDIAILPLIGELDTYRAGVLMENSLKRCTELKNSILIIDLSGVPIVDTMVANQLFQIAYALRLLGVQEVFTGIRPEIAQAALNLGLDFSKFKVMGTLRKALSSLMTV